MRAKRRVLRPVHPNAGTAAIYRRRLDALTREMADSYAYWLKARYRANPPIATDAALPARDLERQLSELGKQWAKRFDDAAPRLAKWFTQSTEKRSQAMLAKILRDAGISVKFQMNAEMRDAYQATLTENVGLIKSIAQQYHTQVEGLVMRSVSAGRDLSALSKELEARFGVTKRRAALIARDQNNKATAVFVRVRQKQAGITKAVWLHSHGGKEPRKTHLANDGKTYDPAKGWHDPDPKVNRRIWPGELINCFPGSTKINFATNVEKAFRHFYSGDLAEIITDSGKSLRATPNHPILTPKGWRPIGSLDEGDYLVEISDDAINAIEPERHIDRTVPLIAEVFETVAQARLLKVALGDEFHGDAIPDGHIDIVFSARSLSFGREPTLLKGDLNNILTAAPHTHFGGRLPRRLDLSSFAATSGFVGGLRELLSSLCAFAPHSNKARLAAVSSLPSNSLNPSLDCLSLMSEPARQRENAFTLPMKAVKATRIVGIERRSFSGHVYNLQTGKGYYSAEGIICHNCRCVSRSIVEGFE